MSPGIVVGHYTDTRRPTGCTAILFDPAATAAADYNSSAPGESQGVMLQPVSPVDRIHALFLTGGGILALPSSGGVLRYFEEHKVGFDWGTPDLRIPDCRRRRHRRPGRGRSAHPARTPMPPTRRARRLRRPGR